MWGRLVTSPHLGTILINISDIGQGDSLTSLSRIRGFPSSNAPPREINWKRRNNRRDQGFATDHFELAYKVFSEKEAETTWSAPSFWFRTARKSGFFSSFHLTNVPHSSCILFSWGRMGRNNGGNKTICLHSAPKAINSLSPP